MPANPHAVDLPDVLGGSLIGHMTDSCYVHVTSVGDSPLTFRSVSATVDVHFFLHADGQWRPCKPGEIGFRKWSTFRRDESKPTPPTTARKMLGAIANVLGSVITEQHRLLGAQVAAIEDRSRADAEVEKLRAAWNDAVARQTKAVNTQAEINGKLDGEVGYVLPAAWSE